MTETRETARDRMMRSDDLLGAIDDYGIRMWWRVGGTYKVITWDVAHEIEHWSDLTREEADKIYDEKLIELRGLAAVRMAKKAFEL